MHFFSAYYTLLTVFIFDNMFKKYTSMLLLTGKLDWTNNLASITELPGLSKFMSSLAALTQSCSQLSTPMENTTGLIKIKPGVNVDKGQSEVIFR